jgi:hypothetical protein
MVFMKKSYLMTGILIIVALGVYFMFGRGGSVDTKDAYRGQWLLSGAGQDIMNFRADGTFSEVNWGTIGRPSTIIAAIKGTYSFTPATKGDLTHGDIYLRITHDYNTEQKKWVVRTDPVNNIQTCVIIPGSKIILNGSPFARYGSPAKIPEVY